MIMTQDWSGLNGGTRMSFLSNFDIALIFSLGSIRSVDSEKL